MNPVKLALLINDTFDAVEQSKIGQIYLRKPDGSLNISTEGAPWANTAAMQTFHVALQAQIMKASIYED